MVRNCSRCKVNKALIYLAYARVHLCVECFNKFFENRVRKNVEKYRMLKGDYVGVGLSGGKDSASLLYALKKLYGDRKFIAIHLDHGIGEYSKDSLEKAKALAEALNVEFHVFDYKKELGLTIPEVKKTKYGSKVCSFCGTIRRWALAKAARELKVDVLATGHNLDDMVETMLNLFLTGNFSDIVRLKPVLPPEHPSQVWKIKPLFNSPETDNLSYALYNELPTKVAECPYRSSARSVRRKRMLDEWESKEPNIKFQLLSVFTKKLMPLIESIKPKHEYRTCNICGGISLGEVCSACRRLGEVKSLISF